MKLYRDEKIKTAMDILLDLRNEFPACDPDAAKFRNMITSVRRILDWEHEEGVCGAFPSAVTWEPEPAVREPELKTVRCCDCSMLEQYPGGDGKSVSRCGLFDICDVSRDEDHKCEYFRASSPELKICRHCLRPIPYGQILCLDCYFAPGIPGGGNAETDPV